MPNMVKIGLRVWAGPLPSLSPHLGYPLSVFLPRDALVHSAVLRLHVVRLSVCLSIHLSVTLVDQDHTGWNTATNIHSFVVMAVRPHVCPFL